MIYIKNDSSCPYFNLALEEIIFEELKEDVFLLYRNKPSIICGAYQCLNAEVNLLKVYENNLPVLRRFTGGGTVYHDMGNINYTFMAKESLGKLSYKKYLKPVIDVLGEIGFEIEIILDNALANNGKKIGGSAQRFSKDRLIHHGTILYDSDLKRIKDFANGASSFYSTNATDSTPWPVRNLKNVSREKLNTDYFFKELEKAFSEYFNFEKKDLKAKWIERAEKLAKEKYKSYDWIYGKNPTFTFEREFSYEGEEYFIKYEAEKNIVKELETNFKPLELLKGKALNVEFLKEIIDVNLLIYIF